MAVDQSKNIKPAQVETPPIEFKKSEPIMWDIAQLKPYEKNAKIHDDEKISILIESFKEFGFREKGAIEVTENGVIVNGHGRYTAAKKLNLKQVPVIVISDLSENQIDAYRLVDNRSAEGKYNTDFMVEEMRRLGLDAEIDLSRFFSEAEVRSALDDLGDIDMSEISDDLAGEVEAGAKRTAEKLDAEDSIMISIAEVLGFQKITGKQRRLVERFNLLIRSQFVDKRPAEAFVAAISRYMEQ